MDSMKLFGLRNFPSTFQYVNENILLGIQNKHCLVYMDNIIIYSPTINNHLTRLNAVFKRIRKENLKIQPDKCDFLRSNLSRTHNTLLDLYKIN